MVFKKVVVGGTFNLFHRGHEEVLRTALKLGERTVIGLTSDEFANRFRTERVEPYERRREKLRKFLKAEKARSYEIVRIEDFYGTATLDPELDCIVVSEETLLRAEEINAIRFKKGLRKLTVVVVPLVMAEDGKPISSERISCGEIDREGRLLKPPAQRLSK